MKDCRTIPGNSTSPTQATLHAYHLLLWHSTKRSVLCYTIFRNTTQIIRTRVVLPRFPVKSIVQCFVNAFSYSTKPQTSDAFGHKLTVLCVIGLCCKYTKNGFKQNPKH